MTCIGWPRIVATTERIMGLRRKIPTTEKMKIQRSAAATNMVRLAYSFARSHLPGARDGGDSAIAVAAGDASLPSPCLISSPDSDPLAFDIGLYAAPAVADRVIREAAIQSAVMPPRNLS